MAGTVPYTAEMEGAGRKEEGYGLVLAVAAHIALVAFLLWRPPGRDLVVPPERMTVTISEDVSPNSTSPEPDSNAAPDFAPTVGEAQPAPAAEPAPRPLPKAEPEPVPVPKPVARLEPKPIPKPVPKPVARPVVRPTPPKPVARPVPQPVARPAARPAPPAKAPAKPAAKPAQAAAGQSAARPTSQPAGGTRIGADFLQGVQGAQGTTRAATPPAAAAGPTAASLSGAIARALKPRWVAPQGVDADQLVTILSWNFNPDGSLAGTPKVVNQLGITDANRPQAPRHAEQAIRAVQLAASAGAFNLPPDYYNSWKRVASFRFDRRLSQ